MSRSNIFFNDLLDSRRILYPTELPVQYFSLMIFPTKPRKPFSRKRLLCVLVPSWQNFSHEGTKTQRLLPMLRALCGSLHLTAENAEKAQSFCQRTGVFVKSHFSKTIESVAKLLSVEPGEDIINAEHDSKVKCFAIGAALNWRVPVHL